MSEFSDGNPDYLREVQYRDDSNLNARLEVHRRFSTNPQGWHSWVFDRVRESLSGERARILEVGCGPGTLWRENLCRVPANWSVVLSDFSPGMLDAASASLGDPRFAFERFDVQSIPRESASFDAVIANHMLYHVPDRDRALAELRRVLGPGGALFAATNGSGALRELNALVVRFAPRARRHDTEFADRFGLETGEAQLARHFDGVRLVRYRDALRITETEPLLAFIRASWNADEVTGAPEEAMRAHVDECIARDGAFSITKSAGLFIAR